MIIIFIIIAQLIYLILIIFDVNTYFTTSK